MFFVPSVKENLDARNVVEKGREQHGSPQCIVDKKELPMWNKTEWSPKPAAY